MDNYRERLHQCISIQGRHLSDVLFKTHWCKTAICVLSRNRKNISVSSLVLNLLASQIGEFFLPHPVYNDVSNVVTLEINARCILYALLHNQSDFNKCNTRSTDSLHSTCRHHLHHVRNLKSCIFRPINYQIRSKIRLVAQYKAQPPHRKFHRNPLINFIDEPWGQ